MVILIQEATMTRMTDEEILGLLGGDTPLNRARREFSSACARIEQAGQQRTALGSFELRRLEFEAVQKIVDAYCPQIDISILASAIRKIAPDLADQLAERVAAYGMVEDQIIRDLVENLNKGAS